MRTCGILLPLFSLPGPYGIGTMGTGAYHFVDFLVKAKQTYWQLLPLGPTGYGDSPYQSFSAFAGNPYFIDPQLLIKDGLLRRGELPAPGPEDSPVDYAGLYESRPQFLAHAARRLLAGPPEAFAQFCTEQSAWLDDYALFMALKAENGQKAFSQWPEPLRRRQPAAMAEARTRLAGEVNYHKAVQYLFFRQWHTLKAYANKKGIRIIGDIPIYVSPDSSDFWADPALFQTGTDGRPVSVAGCPPDAFSADGQLWGNPLYDWPVHKASGYAWWIRRMTHATSIYDVVRIDHFRGFEGYFSIPADAKTALGGHWEKGPGMSLIGALRAALPEASIIAEDLGYQTPELKAFLAESGFPGMKLLQFAFDSREESDYLPHNYTANSVVYTGTHDNSTTQGWQHAALPADVRTACRYLNCTRLDLTDCMIRAALASVSDTAVIPLQDWLGLDDKARINRPSTTSGNWQWRMPAGADDKYLAKAIASLTELYGRC